tara:strand:- start:147 stop:380 length:234 start_codon:yes stop_codon:yes gene_type:complete
MPQAPSSTPQAPASMPQAPSSLLVPLVLMPPVLAPMVLTLWAVPLQTMQVAWRYISCTCLVQTRVERSARTWSSQPF